MALRLLFLFLSVFVVGVLVHGGKAQPSTSINVMEFGAVGDGKTYDTQAFIKAWNATCGGNTTTTLIIPGGKTFLVEALQFHGPCNFPSISIQILGDIIAPTKEKWPEDSLRYWIDFKNVDNLIISGNGHFDGQGSGWWNCSQGKPCDNRHATLAFNGCNNLQLTGLKSNNSQNNHISINGCRGALISNVQLTAPADSPNTDGIDISESSTNIVISNSTIATGDDCVAITNGCSFIYINNINCGPGHGISIGSLGKNGGEGTVEEVHVSHCTFNGTQNGARIKTWPGGKGYVRKVTYDDITLIAADNPIVINQFYCPGTTCGDQATAVAISNVSFSRVRGTSIAEYALRFNCSRSVPCSGIILDHINITPAEPSLKLNTFCNNAHENSNDTIPPVNCPSPTPSSISMAFTDGESDDNPLMPSSISMVVEDDDSVGHISVPHDEL